MIQSGEAEAAVTLTAVPPKNISGGSDEWPGEPLNWSKTWTAKWAKAAGSPFRLQRPAASTTFRATPTWKSHQASPDAVRLTPTPLRVRIGPLSSRPHGSFTTPFIRPLTPSPPSIRATRSWPTATSQCTARTSLLRFTTQRPRGAVEPTSGVDVAGGADDLNANGIMEGVNIA